MSDWYVGQRVLCICIFTHFDERHPSADIMTDDYIPPLPSKGVVYTIRKIFPWLDGYTFWLAELHDDLVSYHEEAFAPISETALEQQKESQHAV